MEASKKASESEAPASDKPIPQKKPINKMQQKKTPSIKPFNLRNLKSPKYDSSNQLNKGFDPNHKFDHYGHGPHSNVRTNINPRTSPVVSKKVEPKSDNLKKATPITSPVEAVKKKAPAPKIIKKKPRMKPFNMMSLKSPTYDSSNQLNKSLDPNHKFDDYAHGSKEKVEVSQEQQSEGTQMIRKQITNRSGASTGGGLPKKFVLSPTSPESKQEADEEEVTAVEKVQLNEPKNPSIPITKKMKKPFALQSLKSPTYDSSTLLNQAFDPSHDVNDYAHVQADKVAVKKQQQQGMEVKALRKQVTSRSATGSGSRSPHFDSSSSIDSDLRSPTPGSPPAVSPPS